MKASKPDYMAKVQQLSVEEQERLLSRMVGKLPRRLEKDKLSREQAMAIQMELEDEQLQEWRARMHALNADAAKAGKSKAKADDAAKKEAAPGKAKATAKPKTAAKPKAEAKSETAAKQEPAVVAKASKPLAAKKHKPAA